MKYLLLDTNIYLHYRDFEQINWSKIIASSDFSIIVPHVVINEIDKHKDGPRSKLKNRAKAVSAKFAEYFLEDSTQKKLRLIEVNNPSNAEMSTYNLNPEINDDVIIGAALSFGDKENVIVISSDNTLLLKAKSHGLKFLRGLLEEYLISEEKTEEEKELEKLKKELTSLKNRQPLPKLTFEDGKTELHLKRPKLYDINKEVEKRMIYLKLENPYENKNEKVYDESVATPLFNANLFDQIQSIYNARNKLFSDDQINLYNQELDEYFVEYEKYLRLKLEKENLDNQVQEIKFFIHNEGTAETGNMNIFLEFPNNVKLYNKDSCILKENFEPEKPKLGYASGPKFSIGIFGNTPQIKLFDLEQSLPTNKFSICSDSLIHNVIRNLNIEESIYIDTYQSGNFAIKWCICSANRVEATSGVLNVIVE